MSGSDDSRVSRLWGRRRPTGYAQIDDEEKVDLSRDRFPYCVVWTPLPVLSWLVPFIGHVGICDSEGRVHDFAGPYCVSVGAMAFARPMRFMPMYPTEGEREGWDEAIQEGDSIFQQRLHNLFCNNCHHHVVECLNHLRYGGTRDWNQFSLCWLLLINGRNVSRRATLDLLMLCMRATLFIGLVGVVQQKELLCFPTDLYNPHQSNVLTFAPPAYSDCVNCYSSLDGQYYIGRAVKGHDRGEVETVGMCVPKTCLQLEIKLLGKALDNITAVIDLREISPDCRSPSIAGEKRVAVCIEGPFGRADLNVLDSVRQNVVRPLNAKVLLVTDSEKGSKSTLDGVLEFITLGVGEVHAYDIREDITPAEAVDEFFSEGGSRRVLDDAGMTGGELLNLRGKLRCLKLIEKVEKSSSARFDDVVYTRIDLMWLAEHPPLEVLEAAVASPTVWVPDSEDWRGLNDRAAFMPRQLADIYFNRYEAFINGVAAEYFYGMNGMAVTRGEVGDEIFDKIDFSINPEMILRRHLTHHRVRVERYPTVAAVSACQAGRQCIGKPAPLSNGFRFAAEQAVARGNAYLLRVLGWRWSLTASAELSPPCFEADEDRRHCCGEAAFRGKTLCYLDGTYSFDRCCKSMVIGLRKVYDDDDDALPLCINVTDVVNLCYHWKWLDSSCVAYRGASELSDGPLPSTVLSEES
ncbi:hypothetical protein FOZ63_030691 [Perkinsus olseni]|uniref:Transmembrane protein n=2 Tax=Perkinsus olseni TaxID=32597 RepID=A0A7J6RPW7_PEROL|nr:hypothetical protein FOZ63_030691 [Perkinsus olseni]